MGYSCSLSSDLSFICLETYQRSIQLRTIDENMLLPMKKVFLESPSRIQTLFISGFIQTKDRKRIHLLNYLINVSQYLMLSHFNLSSLDQINIQMYSIKTKPPQCLKVNLEDNLYFCIPILNALD